jgi:hypothetical protein
MVGRFICAAYDDLCKNGKPKKRQGILVGKIRKELNRQGKIFKETHFRKGELEGYPGREMVKFEW